ncbi:Transcriptional regulator GlxA family, contains an amidase domain and an AraC-type DNA-binding HTH domain [Filimonas lacunae]|uniref:Transcriptional regulator GlxA family, contains an amidase domain and an AraC-type DNA-binding HTH domain n=1 Tax=Filimonas lacunae TaxID=477680 RepID=A0A173MDI8_9BACT|nr:helix-turn-helix domain-containing protein [Filimonas lacunae]BAV05590.1 transcriptional regulator, AraC family [Filimonas lacunae]SIT29273.1 Transcriptional regulator GlxA family, contains an amidase domain and an AraC-type DNA-binding HTH domain [Filimonas lacunae]
MIHLAVAQPCENRLLSTASIIDVFESVNWLYQQQGHPPFFHIEMVDESQLASGIQYQLILLPAFGMIPIADALQANQQFIPWLQQQYAQGAAIGSFCSGAFLLAASGLLNGKKATTHVMYADALQNSFPEIKLCPEAVVTHDSNVYTSGGATCSFHLMLHLLEKYCGRPIAVQIAKLFSIDMDRNQQAYFSGFQPSKSHSDSLVKEAQQEIESKYMEIATIDGMVKNMPVSPRNFMRRFKQATGITPINYLQNTRIEAARNLLEHTNDSITDIMYSVGYGDMKSFRILFTRITGLSPKAYREKYALTTQAAVYAD